MGSEPETAQNAAQERTGTRAAESKGNEGDTGPRRDAEAESHPMPVTRTSSPLVAPTTMWEIEINSVGNGSERSPVAPG